MKNEINFLKWKIFAGYTEGFFKINKHGFYILKCGLSIGNWFFLARVGIMQTRKVARLYIVHLK